MAAPVGLVGSQTRESLATHAFSARYLYQYPGYVSALLDVKCAAARANEAAGVIDQQSLKRILAAAKALVGLASDPQVFVADVYQGGGGIALNMNVNEALQGMDQQLAQPSAALAIKTVINAGQSTADACASAARIALVRMLNTCDDLIGKNVASLNTRIVSEFSNATFMARTCLQDAMPARLDHFLSGWSAALARHRAVFLQIRDSLLLVNLGGTVIGSGEGASEAYKACVIQHLQEESKLGLSRRENLFDAAQFCDDLLRLGAEAQNFSQTLAKIARDLRLLSSGPQHGFAELKLPKLIQGSSFFAEKNNPTLPETVIQGACLVAGHYASMQAAAMQAELNLNVFEPMIFFLLSDCFTMLSSLTEKLNVHCFSGLQVGAKGVRHEA